MKQIRPKRQQVQIKEINVAYIWKRYINPFSLGITEQFRLDNK